MSFDLFLSLIGLLLAKKIQIVTSILTVFAFRVTVNISSALLLRYQSTTNELFVQRHLTSLASWSQCDRQAA